MCLAKQFEGSLKFMLYLYVDSRRCRNDTVVIVAYWRHANAMMTVKTMCSKWCASLKSLESSFKYYVFSLLLYLFERWKARTLYFNLRIVVESMSICYKPFGKNYLLANVILFKMLALWVFYNFSLILRSVIITDHYHGLKIWVLCPLNFF